MFCFLFFSFLSELIKLSEESLARPPEEVFDIICKLGEGSYGSVYKALHKDTGSVVAIKLVPLESDLHEIIKEISIMQQCDSPYVVRFYGSYFQQCDLWVSFFEIPMSIDLLIEETSFRFQFRYAWSTVELVVSLI